MFYGSKPYPNGNPACSIRNVRETPRTRVRFWCAVCVAWGIGLPRRAGRRLHAMTDAESRWWGWQVSERHAGLTHQYRDARFADEDRGLAVGAPGGRADRQAA